MSKIEKFFVQFRTIPSIILFFAIREHSGQLTAASIGALYALSFVLVAKRSDRVSNLDYGVFFFWVALVVGTLFDPVRAAGVCNNYFTSSLYGIFFLAAFVPQTLGCEPFTTVFARSKTAPKLWQTDQFLAVNRIMSAVWMALFLTAFLISLLPFFWAKVILPLGMILLIGVPFNRKFPSYYLCRQDSETVAKRTAFSKETEASSHQAMVSGDNKSKEEERRMCSDKYGPIKKALVIFGSPRGRKGYTFQLLEQFITGMETSGIEVELINLAEKRIKPCLGCFTCWTKTPGQCIHQDDMSNLLEKQRRADLIVYAQPLYTFAVPGIVKNFLDRSLPRLEPFLVARPDGSTRHPLRWREGSPERIVVFSVCGFPEVGHFDPMLDMFRHLAKNSGGMIVGEILRTSSESLLFHERYQEKYGNLLEDLYKAGQQLGLQGFVSSDLESAIARPFFNSLEQFRQVANQSWKTMLEYEGKKKSGAILPDRREYLLKHPGMLLAGMASQYDPAKSAGLSGVLQFDIIDQDEGRYFIDLSPGGCKLTKGQALKPDLTIKTPWEVWQSISVGRISGQEAFLKGLYQAEGDLTLLMNMKSAMI